MTIVSRASRARTGLCKLIMASAVVLLVGLLQSLPLAAQTLAPIDLGVDAERVDITMLGRQIDARGDALQIETAVAADGTTGRMSVRAATRGTSPNWFVFALKNPTDKVLERMIVADRYSHAGSGLIWPVLDSRQIEAVTPSLGVVPERLPFDNADAFRLTVEPGQTVTFVVELAGASLSRLHLWRAIDYEKRSRNRHLFQGILLGGVGLLAMFLTTIFAANHRAIFPAAALFTWCVLAYLCVDFGFWHKLFNVRPEENAQYRAAGEAAMTASLLIFAHTFLRLGRWHTFIRMLISLAMLATLGLVALAFLDPRLAATFARLGLFAVAFLSALVTIYLAARGQDRALALLPTWILLGVWLFGSALVLTGRLQSDVIVLALTTGLVLIVMLVGFTVTQFAFRTVEPLFGASPDDQQLRALAVDSTGAAVFEWNAKREDIRIGPIVLASLGHKPEEIREPLTRFLDRMHSADRDRLVQVLGGIKDHGRGLVQLEFRLQHVDTSYRWFELEGSGVATRERRMARCVGIVREITDAKMTRERLLHDAVYDSLTNLPNRNLFLDRLMVTLQRMRSDPQVQPTIVFIDLDRFNSVNAAHGTIVGDSLLMTVARRLARLVGPGDALARVGGDQFAMMFAAAQSPRQITQIGEEIRSAVKGVIAIANQDIVLTCSIGLATVDPQAPQAASVILSDAEIAMFRARRGGADRIEAFDQSMRADKDDRVMIEQEIRAAIEQRQLTVLFQPIMYLRTEELAGFEAQVRWDHPRLGALDPAEFVPLTDDSDLIVKLGIYLLQAAIAEAQRWNTEFPRPGNPIFVSVNISTRQLFRAELINPIRQLLAQSKLPKDALRLEITETLVMENPEQATSILREVVEAGARLSLDDFGAGYSSLTYLTTFPFDTIKVDRALVHAATQGASGTAVLRSIVALCHELGKAVVAEGTETEEDVGLMRSLGCDHAQGQFYGESRNARATMAYVKDMRRADKRRKGGGLFRLKPRVIDDERPDKSAAGDAAAASKPKSATPKQGERRSAVRTRPADQPIQSPAPPTAAQPASPPMPEPVAAHAAAPQPSPPPAPPPRLVPLPPSAIEPLSIDRSLSRLKLEISRTTPITRTSAGPPPLPSSGQVASTAGDPRGHAPTPPQQASAGEPNQNGPPPSEHREPPIQPNLTSLPPAIAASLAKLAGMKAPQPSEQPKQLAPLPSTGSDGGGGAA